jgi:hypothetical protein
MIRHFRPWGHGTVYHSNSRYAADAACKHCDLIGRHLPWCITHNAKVTYAYDIVLHPENMTMQDSLILHALGVLWKPVCGCVASGDAAAL